MIKVNFNSRSYKSQSQGQKCENMILATTNSTRSVVRRFDVILTESSISVTILMIKGNFQGHCVNIKVR